MAEEAGEPRTRGHRKKERTRRQLIAAGRRVLAEKGRGWTVSDVITEADVSNGTFYNYFVDRDALFEALVEELALQLAASIAREPIEDPARRFAVATTRVLRRAAEDDTWARVVLRIASRPGAGVEVSRYLREDLAEGLAQGRFDVGDDDATLDLITGLILMTIRRMAMGEARADTIERAVERGLRSLGVAPAEATELATEAVERAAEAASRGDGAATSPERGP